METLKRVLGRRGEGMMFVPVSVTDPDKQPFWVDAQSSSVVVKGPIKEVIAQFRCDRYCEKYYLFVR